MDWLGSLKSEGCGEKGSFPHLRTELKIKENKAINKNQNKPLK